MESNKEDKWDEEFLLKIESLYDRLDEIKDVVKFGESPFRELSYLKSYINDIQNEMFG